MPETVRRKRDASDSKGTSRGRTAPARRKRGSITKDAIMEVASTLFHDRGYDRTSLDDVAANLSITKPSLYYHFASKEDILLECISQSYILFQQSIAERDNPKLPGKERVAIFVRAYVELLRDSVLSMIVADERVMSEHGAEKSRNYKRLINRDLCDRLEAGRKDGSLTFDDTRTVSFAIFGMINWMTHWRSNAPLAESTVLTDRFLALVFNGIAA